MRGFIGCLLLLVSYQGFSLTPYVQLGYGPAYLAQNAPRDAVVPTPLGTLSACRDSGVESHLHGVGDLAVGIQLNRYFSLEAHTFLGLAADTRYQIPLLAKSLSHHVDYHAYSGLIGVTLPISHSAWSVQLKAGASYVAMNNTWSSLPGYFSSQSHASHQWQPTYGVSVLYTPPDQQRVSIFLSYLNILGDNSKNQQITPYSAQVSIADQKTPALYLVNLGMRVSF